MTDNFRKTTPNMDQKVVRNKTRISHSVILKKLIRHSFVLDLPFRDPMFIRFTRKTAQKMNNAICPKNVI